MAGYCFYKHGILPSEYLKLSHKDKALMLASINYFTEQEKKAQEKASGKTKAHIV